MHLWFSNLFPNKSPGSYGALQPYADEMQTALADNAEIVSEIWKRWLLAPSYQRYKTLTRQLNPEARKSLLNELLPKLKQQLHQPEAASVYAKLLADNCRYEEAAHFFYSALTRIRYDLNLKKSSCCNC